MKKILLAEDNKNMREVIADFMLANDYTVDAFENGLLAWNAVQENTYDLILLDIMMPEMDGFNLCEKIRSVENIPIIFITAMVDEKDQLRGYELGADDYIIKPFSLPVLLAKCKVILERNNHIGKYLECGAIKVQPSTRQAFCDDKLMILSSLDFDLLTYFLKNEGRVLTREQIVTKVWGFDYDGNDRSVDTHVKNLRKVLGKYGKCIKTVIKIGYMFKN